MIIIIICLIVSILFLSILWVLLLHLILLSLWSRQYECLPFLILHISGVYVNFQFYFLNIIYVNICCNPSTLAVVTMFKYQMFIIHKFIIVFKSRRLAMWRTPIALLRSCKGIFSVCVILVTFYLISWVTILIYLIYLLNFYVVYELCWFWGFYETPAPLLFILYCRAHFQCSLMS